MYNFLQKKSVCLPLFLYMTVSFLPFKLIHYIIYPWDTTWTQIHREIPFVNDFLQSKSHARFLAFHNVNGKFHPQVYVL